MKFLTLAATACAALTLATSPVAAQTAINGNWTTEDGRAVVTIGNCGNTKCGRLSRILASTPDGPPRDENNPDRSLRNRPVQGITLIRGFTHRGNGQYRGGTIYDPESGRTYNARMQLNGNLLTVTGCVGGGLICQSQEWRRR